MQISYNEWFKKRLSKLPEKIQKQFEKRLNLFIETPNHTLLRVHPLKGNFIGCRAFSVTGDYRVIYRVLGHNQVKFIDIGTHSQVYND